MAFFGLFGKKDKKDNSEKKDNSFFLDQDSAKTFGDIDYMRTPKGVKKTFPTVNGVKGAEMKEIFTATEKVEGSQTEVAKDKSKSDEAIAPSTFEQKVNTRVDSSMDIFLNMAKDIKKK
jgi:hypothetical protein